MSTRSGSKRLRNGEGDSVRFGRGSQSHPVDLILGRNRRLSRVAGVIELAGVVWSLQNQGSHAPLQVIEPESRSVQLLQPGRRAHFAMAEAEIRISIDAQTHFSVHVSGDPFEMSGDDLGRDATLSFTLRSGPRESSMRFMTLLVLCESRLRDRSSVFVPTNQEIQARLVELGIDPGVSIKSIEARLRAVRASLALDAEDLGRSQIRPRLVEEAIRSGWVRPSHLSRLEPMLAHRRC